VADWQESDLSGLTRLELIFAIILAAAASGLVFVLGLSEQRRTVVAACMAIIRAARTSSIEIVRDL